MLHRKSPKTMVQALLEDSQAFGNETLKVWIKMTPCNDAFFNQLQGYLDQLPPEEWFFTPIPANDALGLKPGGYLLFLEHLRSAGFQVDLVRLPSINPILSTVQGCFIKDLPVLSFNDMRLGRLTELTAAAERAREQAPDTDWIGGIADFATRFLGPSCQALSGQTRRRS